MNGKKNWENSELEENSKKNWKYISSKRGKSFLCHFSDFLCHNFFLGKNTWGFHYYRRKKDFHHLHIFLPPIYNFFVLILWPINMEKKDKRKMVLQLSTPFFVRQALFFAGVCWRISTDSHYFYIISWKWIEKGRMGFMAENRRCKEGQGKGSEKDERSCFKNFPGNLSNTQVK